MVPRVKRAKRAPAYHRRTTGVLLAYADNPRPVGTEQTSRHRASGTDWRSNPTKVPIAIPTEPHPPHVWKKQLIPAPRIPSGTGCPIGWNTFSNAGSRHMRQAPGRHVTRLAQRSGRVVQPLLTVSGFLPVGPIWMSRSSCGQMDTAPKTKGPHPRGVGTFSSRLRPRRNGHHPDATRGNRGTRTATGRTGGRQPRKRRGRARSSAHASTPRPPNTAGAHHEHVGDRSGPPGLDQQTREQHHHRTPRPGGTRDLRTCSESAAPSALPCCGSRAVGGGTSAACRTNVPSPARRAALPQRRRSAR